MAISEDAMSMRLMELPGGGESGGGGIAPPGKSSIILVSIQQLSPIRNFICDPSLCLGISFVYRDEVRSVGKEISMHLVVI